MTDRLIAYFDRFVPLTHEEKEAIIQSSEFRHLSAGEWLLRAGRPYQDTYFVLAGSLRQYKMADGEEITTRFYQAEDWIIHLNSFGPAKLATENLICLEESTVLTGNEQKAQQLFRRFPRLETVSRMIMEAAFADYQASMSAYLSDTPEQRYCRLLQSHPNLFQQVPLYHIATYIGVKPESLSRIRRRMAKT